MKEKEYVTPPCGPHPMLGTQNRSINREREIEMQALTRARQAADKIPAPMTKENYGYGKIRY